MIGGPLGALMGIAFGHSFDRGMGKLEGGDWGEDQERIQAAFFTATFSVMGYIAKADGRVSPEEIRLAEAVMERLGLNSEMRASARANCSARVSRLIFRLMKLCVSFAVKPIGVPR